MLISGDLWTSRKPFCLLSRKLADELGIYRVPWVSKSVFLPRRIRISQAAFRVRLARSLEVLTEERLTITLR